MGWCKDLGWKGLHHLDKGPWRRLLYDDVFADLDVDDRLLRWVYLVGQHGKIESWTSGWRHGAW